MEKAYISIRMVLNIMETIRMDLNKVMESFTTLIKLLRIKDSGKMDFLKEKVFHTIVTEEKLRHNLLVASTQIFYPWTDI